MESGKSPAWKIAGYLTLFLLSFLIFDSISLIIGVGVALFALYYFSAY